MATTSTSLTVTIVTVTPDPGDEDLLLEAEIESDDNDGVTTYVPNTKYYLRLYKSTNLTVLTPIPTNIGQCGLSSSGLTASMPPTGETEYITFTGGNTASLNKVYHSNFTATVVGRIYDANGAVTSASLTAPTPGSKTVVASKEIYGVYSVTYTTKYDKYYFQSSVVGQMLMIFIGTSI